MIDTVSDLSLKSFDIGYYYQDLPLSSAGQYLHQIFPSPEFQNYIGGIFKVGADDYIIHNIISGSTANHPTFQILKKQISTAFGQNLTIPFDPANFTSPAADESFMVVRKYAEPIYLGKPQSTSFKSTDRETLGQFITKKLLYHRDNLLILQRILISENSEALSEIMLL